MLQTITNGQTILMRGCYSRPLENFNKNVHAQLKKQDNVAGLLNG